VPESVRSLLAAAGAALAVDPAANAAPATPASCSVF